MTGAVEPRRNAASDDTHLEALGYSGQDFHRSMSLWSNMALGFTYLSPLVGVYSLFAYSLSIGGPPAMWWIVIVGCGQFLVALVFGEVVSQYPIAGGIYPWTRRLWNRKYAWIVSWVYVWAVIVTVTAVAEFGGGFVASLFGIEHTPVIQLVTAVGLLLLALAVNFSGTHMLARVAKIGLAAELIGVVALGLYLLTFKRVNSFSVFFDSMGAGGDTVYIITFLGAALSGLFLFYGFEACGDVAEEVDDPTRRIPKAMMLTIIVGGVSGLMSYIGYVLAAPDLQAIVNGEDPDPIPAILESSLGTAGSKIFLCVAITAFISCVLSLQAAGSRLIYASARDRMLPFSGWLSRMSERHRGAHQRTVGRLRRAHPHLPVRVRGAGSIATHHRVRGARHLHCVPGGGPRGAAAAAEGLATGGQLEPGSVRLCRQRARAVLRDLRNGVAAQTRRHGFLPGQVGRRDRAGHRPGHRTAVPDDRPPGPSLRRRRGGRRHRGSRQAAVASGRIEHRVTGG